MRKRLPAVLIKAVKGSLLLLVSLYFTQSIWLVPLRFMQGEHWRVFPDRVVDIAACDGAVVVAGESGIWGFDRELRCAQVQG
ncbi:MAG: hypothetical protein ACOY3F_02690 [Bacillota bacterium]